VVLHRFVLHNDRIHEASEPILAPGQVGLLSGWGVFTTLRVADGVPFAFERHWARISRDAAAMHVPLPGNPETLRQRLLELVEANRAFNCTLRLVIVRNGGGMWAGPSTGCMSDVIALTADSKDWGEGVKLGIVPHARHAACEFATTKILSWAMNLTWVERAHERGLDEVILLNEHGESRNARRPIFSRRPAGRCGPRRSAPDACRASRAKSCWARSTCRASRSRKKS
jgi:branched-chain amino acid aminotransferase